MHIDFAHQTFKWSNDARVTLLYTVSSLGSLRESATHRRIFEYADIKGEPNEIPAHNISPYLLDAPNVFVGTRQHPISDVPEMNFGNMPADGGTLILSQSERDDIVRTYPTAEPYIYELIGAKELIQGGARYCLWLTDISPAELRTIPPFTERIERNRAIRSFIAPTTR